MTQIIGTQINSIKEMLYELNESVNKCNNRGILSFTKVIGENLNYLAEQIKKSPLPVIEKVQLSYEVEKLEHEFGNINDNFNKCKCSKS